METFPSRASEPCSLVVTGMHRSGTSLLASFLHSAGVNLGDGLLPADEGNPLGYFEDLEFLELQREILLACTLAESGWRDWGWTESQRLDFSHLPSFRPRAEALVRRRQAAGRPWGWKDPRTTILLDFWDEILPNARYIFVYRAPWEVAASIAALQHGPFREHPNFASRIWSFYNRQILDFYRRHRDRCLLVAVASLLSRPEEVLALVRSKLGLLLEESRDGVAILRGIIGKSRLGATGSTASLWRLAAKSYHREAEVWADLERAADLAAGLPLHAEPMPAPFDTQLAVQDGPAFSVVIPCFNQGQFVLAAVASIEDAEEARFELVIVNDGSTDPFTIEVLERLRAVGYRILDQPNRGVGAARNAGIRATRGRYILPLDADNRIQPAYLRRAAEILDSAPAVGVVYGDAALSGKLSGLWRMPEFNLEEMVTGNRIDACGVFRREAWEQSGGYDEGVKLGWEDWDFWLSVAEKGWQFVHVPEVLFEYRLRSASIASSGARQEDRRWMLESIIAKHPAVFGPRLPRMFAEKDAHWLQAEARAALLGRNLTEVQGTLATFQAEVNATRDRLHTALGDLAASRSELQASQHELQASQHNLQVSQNELQAAQNELQAARNELQAAQNELRTWRERVEFMTSTRAWRLRSGLLRLRAALGLLPRS